MSYEHLMGYGQDVQSEEADGVELPDWARWAIGIGAGAVVCKSILDSGFVKNPRGGKSLEERFRNFVVKYYEPGGGSGIRDVTYLANSIFGTSYSEADVAAMIDEHFLYEYEGDPSAFIVEDEGLGPPLSEPVTPLVDVYSVGVEEFSEGDIPGDPESRWETFEDREARAEEEAEKYRLLREAQERAMGREEQRSFNREVRRALASGGAPDPRLPRWKREAVVRAVHDVRKKEREILERTTCSLSERSERLHEKKEKSRVRKQKEREEQSHALEQKGFFITSLPEKIIEDYKSGGETVASISEKYGVSIRFVWDILEDARVVR